jgi:hypothetical protein
MLFYHFYKAFLILICTISAYLPLGLKELYVAIGCQKYPNKVITLGKTDLIHQDLRMLEMKRVDKDVMMNQIFKIQESWSGGIVFKTLVGLRSFRHFDTLKFQRSEKGIDQEPLYLIKEGVKYPRTFQIINNKECLEAIESIDKSRIYLKFSPCDKTDSQLWGAFTEDQVRSYLGMKPISLDRDENNLTRFIEKVHIQSFRIVVNRDQNSGSSLQLSKACH